MAMRETTMDLPKLGLIAATRALLGAGVGLLLGERFNRDQRRAVGWTLLAVGVFSTIPIGIEVFKNVRQLKALGNGSLEPAI